MLHRSTIQHSRSHMSSPTLLLQVIETLENNTFPMGEPVSDVRKIITWITGRHMKVPPCRVYPEFCVERCAGTWGKFFHVVSSIYSRLLFYHLQWLFLFLQ